MTRLNAIRMDISIFFHWLGYIYKVNSDKLKCIRDKIFQGTYLDFTSLNHRVSSIIKVNTIRSLHISAVTFSIAQLVHRTLALNRVLLIGPACYGNGATNFFSTN